MGKDKEVQEARAHAACIPLPASLVRVPLFLFRAELLICHQEATDSGIRNPRMS
jgi:hypothetical protein